MPGQQIKDMYDLVNSWSAAQQLFSDLYVTWPLILVMCLGALREYYEGQYECKSYATSN